MLVGTNEKGKDESGSGWRDQRTLGRKEKEKDKSGNKRRYQMTVWGEKRGNPKGVVGDCVETT